jgi:hypothetical protein
VDAEEIEEKNEIQKEHDVKNAEIFSYFERITGKMNFLHYGLYGLIDYELRIQMTAGTSEIKEETQFSCNYCHKVEEKKILLRCSRCKSIYYCCKEHQSQDWSEHKVSKHPKICFFLTDFLRFRLFMRRKLVIRAKRILK